MRTASNAGGPVKRNSRKLVVPEFVLASGSPRRAALLRDLGLSFIVVASAASEVSPDFLSPAETAMANAWLKAWSVSLRHSARLVLAADTVVSVGDVHFGKPASLDEAIVMLTELQGKTHQVATGVCLLHRQAGRARVFSDTTTVTFRPLKPAQIQRYLASIEPFDKAGGYAIQENGTDIIAEIQGSYSNVVGLPIERLEEELRNWSESN